MNIEWLEISNILSIENAKVDFESSGLVLVDGWNHDVGRANGAGKTAIFNCLSFALYDKLPRKITASEIIRRGCKTGYVCVGLKHSDGPIIVTRSRPKGVRFEHKGVVVDWTQEEFEAKIRLSYDQFVVSQYAAQNNQNRFLLLNDSGKKDFLIQLLNLNEFSECKKFADSKVATLEQNVAEITAKQRSLQAKSEAYSESLIDVKEVSSQIEALEVNVHTLISEINQVSNTLAPDLSKYSKIEDGLRKKQSVFAEARAKRSLLHDQYRRLQAKIKPFSGNDKCNACGSSLDVIGAKKAHELEMETLRGELLSHKREIDECEQVLSEELAIADLQRKLIDKKSSETEDKRRADARVGDLRRLLDTTTAKRESCTLKLLNNNELLSKINNINLELTNLVTSIANDKRSIELYKTVAAMYSPTGAQAYILDSVVESFNECMSDYVDLLWPNATYMLTSHRENSKGELTARFSEKLHINGEEVSVGSLSGGELRALSLCADFAILDILEMHFGLSMNPIILDEQFNDLDSVGRELVVELLEKLAIKRQIFVIDHATEAKSMFSKRLSVHKRNSVSHVSYES